MNQICPRNYSFPIYQDSKESLDKVIELSESVTHVAERMLPTYKTKQHMNGLLQITKAVSEFHDCVI